MLTPVINGSRLPVDLDTGRVLAPGETCDADLADPHNAALIASGTLVAGTVVRPYRETPVGELHALAEARGLDHTDLNKEPLIELLAKHDAEEAV